MKATVIALMLMLGLTLSAFAADDPNIKGQQRQDIKAAMQTHVEKNTVNGDYVVYDAVTDKVLKLKFKEFHKGVVKKSDYYVSCADFHDTSGKYYDLDFLVVEENGQFRALQGVVHKVGKNKRKYHLEN